MAFRVFWATIIWIVLLPEWASGQAPVSATASVRAEVRQACPAKSKKKECKPKPPKDDDDDDDDDRRRAFSPFASLGSILESAEATSVDGATVLPSRVVVWVAGDRSTALSEEHLATMDQEKLAVELAWIMATHKVSGVLLNGARVITVVAEY
jgi:hypothetical protein